MTRSSDELVGGGFAYMTAPFGVHPLDQERALEYRDALVAEKKTWRDAEAQIRAYLTKEGVAASVIDAELVRAKLLIAPLLTSRPSMQ